MKVVREGELKFHSPEGWLPGGGQELGFQLTPDSHVVDEGENGDQVPVGIGER